MGTDEIKLLARKCHTRLAWSEFFAQYNTQISSTNQSKLIVDLLKQLDREQQFDHLDPSSICTLLKASLSCWDLKLGTKIANRAAKFKSPQIAVLSAKVFLEAGDPGRAREIAQKTSRSKFASPNQKLELETILCNTYIDEGNRSTALRLLSRMSSRLNDLDQEDKTVISEIEMYIGRTYFLLGRYERAAESFRVAGSIFVELGDWENGAKAYFNASASLDNSGSRNKKEAFYCVERCRQLAVEHDLRGPLAHCEAFYGHNDYWQGNFAGAREHFRKALSLIPTNVDGYRRLHLLSMLAFTYLRTGKYSLAEKFGNETLRLASGDQRDRFTFRFYNLSAEIQWERYSFSKSQKILVEGVIPLSERGVHVLEELSTLSRYYIQTSLLGSAVIIEAPTHDESLRNSESPWCEYLHALGLLSFSKGDHVKALELFKECNSIALSKSDYFHIAKSLLGMILVDLKKGDLAEAENSLSEFQIAVAQMIDTPLKVYTFIISAALSYRRGNLTKTAHHLRLADKVTQAGRAEKTAVKSWLATIDGHSGKLTEPDALNVVGTLSKWFFAPSIKAKSELIFVISEQYEVDLSSTPHLALFLRTLLNHPGHELSNADIHATVWNLGPNQRGWQQKVRNSIQRLRELFTPSIAPLIIHTDSKVRLFDHAIKLSTKLNEDLDINQKILKLIESGPMSSIQLSNRLKVSPATAKRALKDMSEEDAVKKIKVGRRIFYGSPHAPSS